MECSNSGLSITFDNLVVVQNKKVLDPLGLPYLINMMVNSTFTHPIPSNYYFMGFSSIPKTDYNLAEFDQDTK